jgi:hypothetical protein
MFDEYTKKRKITLSTTIDSPSEIARVLSCEGLIVSRSAVSKLLKRVREDKPRYSRKTGRPTKISTELCDKIDQAYRSNTELSARDLKIKYDREDPDNQLSIATIKRARRKADWVCRGLHEPHYSRYS